METDHKMSSFEKMVQSVSVQQDEYNDIYTQYEPPSAFPVTGVSIQPDILFTGGQGGIKRKHCDSYGISSSTESCNDAELFKQVGLYESGPLHNLVITAGDFKENKNPREQSNCFAPTLMQQPNNQQENVSIPTSYAIGHPPINLVDNSDYTAMSCDSATRCSQYPSMDNTHTEPTKCDLELTVGFLQSKDLIVKKKISRSDGFLLFNEKTPNPSLLPKDCKFVRFPAISTDNAVTDSGQAGGESVMELSLKEQKYIQNIMNNMHGGLQIRCHEGCIFAKRWCKAKIFYRSNDTANTTKELRRNEEVMIFNLFDYEKTLTQIYIEQNGQKDRKNKKSAQLMDPTIYFTFAQKWAPDAAPVKTCLVWAELKPCLAVYKWDGLFQIKHNDLDRAHASYNSNHLQISNEHSSVENMMYEEGSI